MEFDTTRVFTALNAGEVKVGSKGYFADNLEELKRYVKTDSYLLTLTSIEDAGQTYRFNAQNYSYALFYLVKEPEAKAEPKEVASWDSRPRIMEVWNNDYSEAQELKVLDIRHMGGWISPVVAIDERGNIYTFKHCAELEPAKEAKEPEAEKHYRPYSNADEFIEDYKRRFCPDFKSIPAIWVKNAMDTPRQVIAIADNGVRLVGKRNFFVDYSDFLDVYTYPDGSPCGMEE